MSNNFNQFNEDSSNDMANKQIELNSNVPLSEQIKYSDHEDKSQSPMKQDDSAQASNVAEELSMNTMAKINTSLSFIGKYFNVEIYDILERLKGAIIPFNKTFYQETEKNPDLYGPLWIYTTLVVVITVAANISGYLGLEDPTKFRYNYNIIPYAALFIYGFGFGIPLIVYLVTHCVFKVDIQLVLNISLYGYSFVILLPVLFLCIIPNNIAQAGLLGYFVIHSGGFIFFNMWMLISEQAPRAKYVVLAILALFHIALFFALEFYFFSEAKFRILS